MSDADRKAEQTERHFELGNANPKGVEDDAPSMRAAMEALALHADANVVVVRFELSERSPKIIVTANGGLDVEQAILERCGAGLVDILNAIWDRAQSAVIASAHAAWMAREQAFRQAAEHVWASGMENVTPARDHFIKLADEAKANADKIQARHGDRIDADKPSTEPQHEPEEPSDDPST